MKRVTEPEVMGALEEAVDYSKTAKIYSFFMHKPIVDEAIRNLPCFKLEDEKIKILDVGGGTGEFAIRIAKKNKFVKIYLLELSKNMLKVAKQNILREGLQDRIILVQADAKKIPFSKNFFDASFCLNALHHQKNPEDVIMEMIRVTKGAGASIIYDSLRPSSEFLSRFYANFFGIFSSRLMIKEYYDSLRASFTIREIESILNSLKINSFSLNKRFFVYFRLII